VAGLLNALAAPRLRPLDEQDTEARLHPSVAVLTGLCFVLVAWGLAGVTRAPGLEGFVSGFWHLWALVGFGAGAWASRSGRPLKWLAGLMTGLALMLAVFPGTWFYGYPRWPAFALLLLVGARAPLMLRRREFHLTLLAVLAVSLLLLTDAPDEWTLWLCLGPAWLAATFALTWVHVGRMRVGIFARLLATTLFVALAVGLTSVLVQVLPQPEWIGFGFLPPGADAPGRYQREAPGSPDSGTERGRQGGKDGASQGGSAGGRGGGSSGGRLGAWRDELARASGDQRLSDWQRAFAGLLSKGASWASGALSDDENDASAPLTLRLLRLPDLRNAVLWLLLAAALAWIAWKWRAEALMLSAGLARRWWPRVSMRLSMVGLHCHLAARGIRRAEGQSRLEHLRAAEPHVHPLTYRWWLEAVERYGACRFGGRPATRDAAKLIGDGVNAGRWYAVENRRSASRRAL
jgi:hypothetical protein